MTGRIGPLLPVAGPAGPWDRVCDQLDRTGSTLMYAPMPSWLPQDGSEAELRRRLGRDWRRYEQLPQDRMRRRFVASRLLLRHAAAAVLGTAPDLVDLSYLPGGRPYVRGCDQIDISLSHTEEMMVVGITRQGRIGVDVERADRQLARTGSEAQACTPYERERLDAAGEERRNDLMVRLWTLKEAYSKALGQGLKFRFTGFGFSIDDAGEADGPAGGGDGEIRLVRPDGSPVPGGEWHFGTFPVGERYVVSVAVCDTGFGEVTDLSVGTTLDDGLLDTLLGAPGAFGMPRPGPGSA
ncbi:4'-phosphopantetheinyl transferase family protein [Streptomyces laurentii]|uniref:4'-phosphopantetheinyl transferase family protein n=1 Tax=Streptomyces laurentii TaxID=39478 RepID=UPI0036AB0E0E